MKELGPCSASVHVWTTFFNFCSAAILVLRVSSTATEYLLHASRHALVQFFVITYKDFGPDLLHSLSELIQYGLLCLHIEVEDRDFEPMRFLSELKGYAYWNTHKTYIWLKSVNNRPAQYQFLELTAYTEWYGANRAVKIIKQRTSIGQWHQEDDEHVAFPGPFSYAFLIILSRCCLPRSNSPRCFPNSFQSMLPSWVYFHPCGVKDVADK